jgi:hypothetical protein
MPQQSNEKILYEQFALQMKQLNDEQHLIVNDILYKKIENPMQPLYIFLTWGVRTYVYNIIHVIILHKKICKS